MGQSWGSTGRDGSTAGPAERSSPGTSCPTGAGAWPPSPEALWERAAAVLRGCSQDDPRTVAEALADELGLGQLLADLRTAVRIVVAADTYHPVASFFVEGSEERQFIQRVLGR